MEVAMVLKRIFLSDVFCDCMGHNICLCCHMWPWNCFTRNLCFSQHKKCRPKHIAISPFSFAMFAVTTNNNKHTHTTIVLNQQKVTAKRSIVLSRQVRMCQYVSFEYFYENVCSDRQQIMFHIQIKINDNMGGVDTICRCK